jgi:hypothetical protein
MSTFESDDFRWRETYFVLFQSARRPKLDKVEKLLHKLSDRYQITNLVGDEEGRFESVTLLAPDDYAALDICYVDDEEVREQATQLVKEMKNATLQPGDLDKLAKLPKCDVRFDIMHFEQVTDDQIEEGEEMLDPSALLLVLDALVDLTGGVGIDPQSGALM